jgi:hypothetical protein
VPVLLSPETSEANSLKVPAPELESATTIHKDAAKITINIDNATKPFLLNILIPLNN